MKRRLPLDRITNRVMMRIFFNWLNICSCILQGIKTRFIMGKKLLFLFAMAYSTFCFGQQETIKAIVLINGTAYLVDVTPKGDITTTYQKIENYFQTAESHSSIMTRLSKAERSESGSIVFYEQQSEPVPSFSEENKKPVDVGNDQYIGFSPDRAILLKTAVDQIRRMADGYRTGTISKIAVTSYFLNNYRSKSLARNRAKAINDLLIAFGVPQSQISIATLPGNLNAKIDFVNIGFGQ